MDSSVQQTKQIFQSRLKGQDLLFKTIRESINDLPHLFITGPNGCGKTTFLEDLISLLKMEGPFQIESVLWLSSEKDRGIHTIRDKVNDFCKRAHSKPNSLRWILIDDADSLPLISQQALRRPMETFCHLTRFVFASRFPGNLIEPLRSRCLMLELEPISFIDIIPSLIPSEQTNQQLIDICQRNFTGLHEVKVIIELYKALLKEKKDIKVLNELLPVCKPYTDKIIQGLSTKNEKLIRESITNLFLNGYLLDDILLSIENSVYIFPNTNPDIRFRILHFTMLGWISIQQGKEHWLDTMDIIQEVLLLK
jgi:DNA polymerase III delta prime subunit